MVKHFAIEPMVTNRREAASVLRLRNRHQINTFSVDKKPLLVNDDYMRAQELIVEYRLKKFQSDQEKAH